MNNFSIRSGVLAVIFFAVVSGFVPMAQAADLGDGWSDYGSYDGWGDVGTYDGWSDYGSYDNWSDYGSYDNWSDYGTYGGYTDTYYYDNNDQNYTDYYYPDQTYTDYYYPDQSYTDYYYPDSYGGYSNYDYGCGSYCGGSSWYTPTYSTGCGSWCGGSSYTTPRYVAPSSSSYYNSNTVTNTNVNNVTNIDNSIRDSFNNYNSGNTSIVVSAPQTPVYTQPAPYCTINSSNYGYGSGAYLSWTATNASSAYISQIGNVALSGSQMVYGHGTYTMTVYGYNGQQATCVTTVQGQVYVPPTYTAPYVSLTQIPYTGFDFGTFGNAMYWAGLLGFAVAGAYLMVYYRGGAFALATAMVPARRQKFAPIVAPKAPILVEKEALAASHAEEKVQPILTALRKAAGTIDTMAIVASKDGSMPKIVIQRA